MDSSYPHWKHRAWILLAFLLSQDTTTGVIAFAPSRAQGHTRHLVIPTSLSTMTQHKSPRIPPLLLRLPWSSIEEEEVIQSSSSSSSLEISQKLFSSDKLPSGLTSIVMPLATVLDDATDGWALEYADLTPESESTPAGVGFLATNLAYAVVGLALQTQGDVFYGTLVELASVASFAYHYTQLNLGPSQPAVRLALLVDYVIAGATLLTASIYLATNPGGFQTLPAEALGSGILSVACLGASWKWEEGMPYIINHGLWHLFGAYFGYVLGMAHLAAAVS